LKGAFNTTRLQFTLKRAKNFLSTFGKNKRGMFGILILLFFLIMAVGAPLFTPYNPTQTTYLAAAYAAPSWLRFLPGSETLSENINPIISPEFSTPDTLNKWSLTTQTSQSVQEIQIRHLSTIGNPFGSGPGSIAVTYKREAAGSGDATVAISQEIFYPYTGPPGRFAGNIAFRVEGTGTQLPSLDVPVKVTVFLQSLGGEKWTLWPVLKPSPKQWYTQPIPPFTPTGEINSATPMWVLSKASPESNVTHIDSGAAALTSIFPIPLQTFFNASLIPGRYIYGAEILFKDSSSSTRVETTVYLDDLDLKLFGTSWGVLGTDHYGRDIFSQLLYGSRISLYIGLLSAILSVVLGLGIGLASGYLGGILDEIMMRATDMLLVIPSLPLLIVLIAVLGPNMNVLILLLGFLGWMGFARVVRSQVLSLKERPFIEAAKAVGAGKTYITIRHIVPNVMSLVYVTLATTVPGNIVAEAALSWLGFYDPFIMSWGRMLHDVQEKAAIFNWWWVIPPGLAIALVAISFIMVGYALDDILNPKLRLRR